MEKEDIRWEQIHDKITQLYNVINKQWIVIIVCVINIIFLGGLMAMAHPEMTPALKVINPATSIGG